MKLTRKEALRLIDEDATEEPVVGALDRVLNHDWTFDPRGSQLTLLLRRFHEQDQVLYGTWTGFEKQLVFPVIEGPYPLRCVLCATSISSDPTSRPSTIPATVGRFAAPVSPRWESAFPPVLPSCASCSRWTGPALRFRARSLRSAIPFGGSSAKPLVPFLDGSAWPLSAA